MTWVIVGLGNPGDEYVGTRHNAGRIALEYFAKLEKFPALMEVNKHQAHVASGTLSGEAIVLVAPDTYMNKSGLAVSKYVKSVKAAEKLILIYDDLDLPLGSIKISYDRGSGGHKGVESVIKALKTKKFTRIRVGVSPVTSSGKIKKPHGKEDVLKFILSKFKTADLDILKKVNKMVAEAIKTTIEGGYLLSMNSYN